MSATEAPAKKELSKIGKEKRKEEEEGIPGAEAEDATAKETKKKKNRGKKKDFSEEMAEEVNASEKKELDDDSAKETKKKKKRKKESTNAYTSSSSSSKKRSIDGSEKKRKKKTLSFSEKVEVFPLTDDGTEEGSADDSDTPPPSSYKKVRYVFSLSRENFDKEFPRTGDEFDHDTPTPAGYDFDQDFPPLGYEFDLNNPVRGRRFSWKEDCMTKASVGKYVKTNQLGDDKVGLDMVLHCGQHSQLRKCWKEIASFLPWRPVEAIYSRAHILFERCENPGFSKEELAIIKRFHEKNGPKWKELAKVLGKQRIHVKDAWRRIRLNVKEGRWSQGEYQNLFDLVNLNLRLKAFEEKKEKKCMIRENIPWEAISDRLTTRSMSSCCHKWYDQLTSPMVREGIWADTNDYLLLDALQKQDACCVEDVDWDCLLEERDGEVCRKRWGEMIRHIGGNKEKSFIEQVDVLVQRYSMDMLQYRTEVD